MLTLSKLLFPTRPYAYGHIVAEALAEGQEVWEELTGQRVEDTDWRRKAKEQLRAMEKAVERMMGTRCRDRDMVFEKG